ncbi:MAG TPA: RNA 2',3'-cyclic phosphodiesterase [Gaiellaceae bacterium]|nr:RNA 2',3'-cyclic phosphodiesterase [Gaiellaceae bacterium]
MARDSASRPEAKRLRLFVAVEVPEEVRSALAEAVAPLRERFPRARWVPEQNQHVTVKFIGSTYPRLVEWVTSAVGQVASAHEAFETRATDLGAFPSARRARVLWAGLDDTDSRSAAIAGALDEALAREFRVGKRPFTPHLTVARFDPSVELDLGEVPFESEAFLVDRVVLFRSHLRRPAPVYEPLEAFSLGARSGRG